ncbi:MAG: adenosylcobinamide-GDP ribazoletransferase, partial [Pseudomonadota bacterium]
AIAWVGIGACITGALHEDGLADTCDGLWGGWTRDRRLTIMKDSHIGTYGVLALICTSALKISALSIILPLSPWAVMGVMAVSRACMVPPMGLLPNARDTGLSHSVGRPTQPVWITAVILAALIALCTSGWIVLIPMALTTAGIGWIAAHKIGGQTGDVLGAIQQISEMAGLVTLAVVLSPA